MISRNQESASDDGEMRVAAPAYNLDDNSCGVKHAFHKVARQRGLYSDAASSLVGAGPMPGTRFVPRSNASPHDGCPWQELPQCHCRAGQGRNDRYEVNSGARPGKDASL